MFNLNLGFTVAATDNVVDKNNNLVLNATQTGQAWSVADPSIATVVTNPDGSATFTPVAVGSTTASVTATVTAPGFGPTQLSGSDTLNVVDTPAGLQIVWGAQTQTAKKA